MDDFWMLVFLSLCMLVGCYVAGSIPLAVTLSEAKLRQVVVFGAGLLIGTALAVIIPEGVHTLYSAQLHEHKAAVGRHLLEAAGSEPVLVHQQEHADEHAHANAHVHTGVELHTWIGVSLVLGFIFMLLVDQLSGGGAHSHGPVAAPSLENGGAPIGQNRKKMTLTIGLVVHAAADGVALGAAATMSQVHVEMIVFVAIMLHKAPAAFGLVSFLMHDGFDRTRIRKHLAIFSAAAPVLALVTFCCLSQQGKQTLTNVNATGIAMLFSAGTFLYVATVHVLPEVAGPRPAEATANSDGTLVVHEHHGFNRSELFLMVAGSLLPLVLSLGHHH